MTTKESIKQNESGRSMVEMLGVLAIIGVLSMATVFGIGYAFGVHKEVETLNTVSKVVAGVVTGLSVNESSDSDIFLLDADQYISDVPLKDDTTVETASGMEIQVYKGGDVAEIDLRHITYSVCKRILESNVDYQCAYKNGRSVYYGDSNDDIETFCLGIDPQRRGPLDFMNMTEQDTKMTLCASLDEGVCEEICSVGPVCKEGQPAQPKDKYCYRCEDEELVALEDGSNKQPDGRCCIGGQLTYDETHCPKCTDDEGKVYGEGATVGDCGICQGSHIVANPDFTNNGCYSCNLATGWKKIPVEGKQECGGQCLTACTGEGMTGEMDPSTCACKCRDGLDKEGCKCPDGQIYISDSDGKNGRCERLHCEKTTNGSDPTRQYSCYINGHRCGAYCKTNNPKNKDDCFGYCSDHCPTDGKYTQETLGWSGFGCEASNGLYCGSNTWAGGSWICAKSVKDAQNGAARGICCYSTKFGVCEKGTCDPSDCNQVDGEYDYVAERTNGCKVIKNNHIAYCVPYDGTWICLYEKQTVSITPVKNSGYIISKNPAWCGTCSADEIKNGNCGTCFSGDRNCPSGRTWNNELKRCIGTYNGQEFSCDFSGNCYEGRGNQRCGYQCREMKLGEDKCGVGMCGDDCPDGSEYGYSSKIGSATYGYGAYGCRTKRDGYTFFFKDGKSGESDACYIEASDNKLTLCGAECDKDCSNCNVYYHSACSKGKCPMTANGTKIDKDGDGEPDCECEGSVSDGYCCEKGYVHTNGKCQIMSCLKNQCISLESSMCKTPDMDTCKDANGVCQHVDLKIMKRNEDGTCKYYD